MTRRQVAHAMLKCERLDDIHPGRLRAMKMQVRTNGYMSEFGFWIGWLEVSV